MSADNWANCPRCLYRKDRGTQALRKTADDAYGKVSIETWRRLDAAAKAGADKTRSARIMISAVPTRARYHFPTAEAAPCAD